MARISRARVAAFFLFASTLAAGGDVPGPRPIGAGGFPVSPMHASAWFTQRAVQDGETLTLMVYLEGTPGWHDRTTGFNFAVNASPATIEFKIPSQLVRVAYWPETRTVQIMGHDFDLGTDNVFLVSGTDGAAPTVRGLGTHDLTIASDDNPAIALLHRDAALLDALLGEAAKRNPVAPTPMEAPSEVVAIHREGSEFLARNTEKDDKQAVERFGQAAAKGYAPAQYDLGICYGTGRGVALDLAAANEWYLKAAEQGYQNAQYKLAHSYRVGRGGPVDLPLALKWYERAAENGDTDAMYNLGAMHALGQGAEASPEAAFGWFLKGAESGGLPAVFEVARRYREGDGVPKDLASADAWFLVLRARRHETDTEGWKRVEEGLAAVEPNLSEESRAEAAKRAEQILRDFTRRYLKSLAGS